MAILDNVVFAYVKIQKPVKGLNEGSTEFTVDAIVSKAAAKAWNKEHPKNKAKEFDNDDFLEKFKFDEIPEEFEDQDEQFVIKFKKAHSKDGEELPAKYRPRVFLPATKKGGKPTDVTFDLLVANGSKGKVSYGTFTNSFGTFTQLDAILVEELVEYDGGEGSATPGSDFGVSEDDLADAPKNQKAVNKQTDRDEEEEEDEEDKPARKPAAKPAAKKPAAKPARKAAVDNDMDDDIPF